jgi:hypothetical protein
MEYLGERQCWASIKVVPNFFDKRLQLQEFNLQAAKPLFVKYIIDNCEI